MPLGIKSKPKLIDLYAGKAWLLETSLINELVNSDIQECWCRFSAEIAFLQPMESDHQSVFKDTILNPSVQHVERISKTSEESDPSYERIKSMKRLSGIPSKTILTQLG